MDRGRGFLDRDLTACDISAAGDHLRNGQARLYIRVVRHHVMINGERRPTDVFAGLFEIGYETGK